jgi:hypothetical protein
VAFQTLTFTVPVDMRTTSGDLPEFHAATSLPLSSAAHDRISFYFAPCSLLPR